MIVMVDRHCRQQWTYVSSGTIGGRPRNHVIAAGEGVGYVPAVSDTTAKQPSHHWAWWAGLSALLVLGLDQATKWWIQAQIPGGSHGGQVPAEWPGWLAWHHNTGVAWGVGGELPWVVAGLTVVLIPILGVVWWRQYRHSAWNNLAWGMILGGAVGNAIDRLLSRLDVVKGVRDFIHVDLGFWPLNPWPTFNIADAGITVGVVILLAVGMLASTKAKPVPA